MFHALEDPGDFLHMGIDGEGPAVAVGGGGKIIELDVAVAHACEGAEMGGDEIDYGAVIVEGMVEVFEDEVSDGALVECFGEVWIDFESFVEVFEREAGFILVESEQAVFEMGDSGG